MKENQIAITEPYRTNLRNLIEVRDGRIREIVSSVPRVMLEDLKQLQKEVKHDLAIKAKVKEIAKMKVTQEDQYVWEVLNGEKLHHVIKLPKKLWCSCIYFRYNQKCKHVIAVESYLNEKEQLIQTKLV